MIGMPWHRLYGVVNRPDFWDMTMIQIFAVYEHASRRLTLA